MAMRIWKKESDNTSNYIVGRRAQFVRLAAVTTLKAVAAVPRPAATVIVIGLALATFAAEENDEVLYAIDIGFLGPAVPAQMKAAIEGAVPETGMMSSKGACIELAKNDAAGMVLRAIHSSTGGLFDADVGAVWTDTNRPRAVNTSPTSIQTNHVRVTAVCRTKADDEIFRAAHELSPVRYLIPSEMLNQQN
jgi:hypothetical protein